MRQKHRGIGTGSTRSVERRLLMAAALGIVLILVATVYAFGRKSLLADGHEVRAMFANATQLKKGSAVRRAGLDIGSVLAVEASPDGRALVTMRIDGDAPPLRSDTQMAIRPRLAFEGNFYVDVVGGSDRASALGSGDTLPLRQTSGPVQLDEVLSTLDAPVRSQAKGLVTSLSTGLGAGEGGESGASGLRRAAERFERTLPAVGRVSRAFRGTGPGDLGRALESTAAFTATLARNPQALAGIIASYDQVVGTLAAHDAQLAASLRAAASTLRTAPASLTKLDGMLPELERFSTNLRPTLDALPATLRPANRAFAQLATLARPDELPALIASLDAPVRKLPNVVEQLEFALPYVGPIGRCLSGQVVPVLNQRVPDGKFTIDQPAWLEILHAAANLTGGSPAFDGNGTTFRAGLGVGTNVAVGVIPALGNVVGNFDTTLEGVSPKWLGYGKRPPMRPDVPCETQTRNLDLASQGVPFGGKLKVQPSEFGLLSPDDKQDASQQLLRPLLRSLGNVAAGRGASAPTPDTETTR